MTFIVAYVPDDLFEMLPDYLFQNDRPDEMGRTASGVAPIVGTDEMILPFLVVAGGTVVHSGFAVCTIDQTGKHMGFARLGSPMPL